MTPDAVVPALDLHAVEALRADLAAASYTVEAVTELLGPMAAAALDRDQVVPGRRVVQERWWTEPAAPLVAAFLLGLEVPRRHLEAALPRLGVAGAVRLGLVVAAGSAPADPVRALIDLRPYAAVDAAGSVSWWLASDLGEVATGTALAADHVLGAGGASVMLARATVRGPVGRALDLGTGCGIQALHASRHAGQVVATDISARALRFAALNAALDDVVLDLRLGSMLAPVAGETFDLVVSNPPFVITPPATGLPSYDYRDGGQAGDAVVAELIRTVGSVLAPGGVAQLLGNWEHRRGEPWAQRVGRWVDGSGLDAWVVQREVLDPAEYAETWIRDGGTTPDRDPAAWARAYATWLDDFAAREVEAVGFGLVTLRRPAVAARAGGGSGGRLRRLEEVTGPVHRPLGDHIAAGLAGHEWLRARDDAALGEARLVVPPDVTEERHHAPGAADPSLILLRQGGGFGRTVAASTGLAALVGACDGDLPVGALVAAVSGLLGVPAADLAADLLPQVRELVRDGFLAPAPAAAPTSAAG